MRTSHKTTAIVLNTLDYGESDRILTVYTEDFGKLKGIAKGARRSRKRFSNALEPFSLSHVIFSRKDHNSMVLIESCDVINHHSGIRENLDKTLFSSYLLELTDKFTREGKRDESLFQLLHTFLWMIDTGSQTEEFIRFFEIRLLKLAGYEPVLDRCMHCKGPISPTESYQFIPSQGGIRCLSCHGNSFEAFPVSVGTLKSLLLGSEIDVQKINRISLTDQAAQESRLILSRFIRHILGRELKSLSVLYQIRDMGI